MPNRHNITNIKNYTIVNSNYFLKAISPYFEAMNFHIQLLVVFILNASFSSALDERCPNLTIKYQEFPKFYDQIGFNIIVYKSVDPSLKSPFYIDGHIYRFHPVYNLFWQMKPHNENSEYQTMQAQQACDIKENTYFVFNTIRYRQNKGDNRLFLEYESAQGDIFCHAQGEMSEIYFIEDVNIGTDRSKLKII